MIKNIEKTILILGASELQVPAIECAQRLGIKCIAVDYDENAAGANITDVFYNVSTLDYEAVLKVAEKENINGIVTICSDRPMTVVARVGEKLGLNTITYQTAINATNKAKMRCALAENNVPIPKFSICESLSEFCGEAERYTGPFIVKPSDNSGSRGITLVANMNELEGAYTYARENSLDGIVLIEEYMRGPEVSVEVFVTDNIPTIVQITDKITTGPPHFVEMGHTQPSQLNQELIEDIKKVTCEAVKAIGIDKGPAHVEIKVTESGAKIVELGARLGGDYIATDLVPLSTGVDLVEATVMCALGEKIPEYRINNRYSAIRYFSYKNSINLRKASINNLERIYLNRVSSEDIKSSRDREGFYIVSADSSSELNTKIRDLDNQIL